MLSRYFSSNYHSLHCRTGPRQPLGTALRRSWQRVARLRSRDWPKSFFFCRFRACVKIFAKALPRSAALHPKLARVGQASQPRPAARILFYAAFARGDHTACVQIIAKEFPTLLRLRQRFSGLARASEPRAGQESFFHAASRAREDIAKQSRRLRLCRRSG
jgi:hypothetical protein